MFKPGQVIRSKLSGNLALVQMVDYNERMCRLYVLSGPSTGETLWPFTLVDPESEIVGNNYRVCPAPLPDNGDNGEPMPRETHNLIQNLRRDNKELRRQNKDLRDDIGDMASKLHLAYRDKFPGIAALWSAPEALPEQRGCRKEDC